MEKQKSISCHSRLLPSSTQLFLGKGLGGALVTRNLQGYATNLILLWIQPHFH